MKLPQRDSKLGVGKTTAAATYIHISSVEAIPEQILAQIVDVDPGFDVAVIKFNLETGDVSLIESKDFDTADEPLVGRSYVVKAGKVHNPPKDPWIYHHKWLMVKDDYDGFDVEASKERSRTWIKALGDEPRDKIGRRSYWRQHVLPLLEDPKTGAMILEERPTADLIPYARNARTHSPEQVDQIAASIAAFGFNNPVLVDPDGVIIAGHGRVVAAKQLRLETVPVIVLGHLTDAQRKAFIIADNKLALNAGWDEQMLALEIGELAIEEFDLGLTGFDDDELADLLPRNIEDDRPPDEFGGATAMHRASVPIRYWRDKGYLEGDVLDLGCGHEEHEFMRYDAAHQPDPTPLLATYDVVMSNYVLNVQPAEHLIIQLCVLMSRLIKPAGKVLIAVRSDLAQTYTSPRGTQVAKTAADWEEIIGQVMGVEQKDAKEFFGYECWRRP